MMRYDCTLCILAPASNVSLLEGASGAACGGEASGPRLRQVRVVRFAVLLRDAIDENGPAMSDDQPNAQRWRATHSASDANDDAPAEVPGDRFLRIDEVARRTNLTKRTLRYYEELGLLEPAQRSEGNYRLYSESDVHALEHIKAMRDLLGLELKEIRELVAAELERERIRRQWQADSNLEWRLTALDEVEQVARRELELLQERLAGLEEMRGLLLERLERYQRTRVEIRAQLHDQREVRKDEPQQARG
jgi:DNA-binding transcriptional MerR regulator